MSGPLHSCSTGCGHVLVCAVRNMPLSTLLCACVRCLVQLRKPTKLATKQKCYMVCVGLFGIDFIGYNSSNVSRRSKRRRRQQSAE
eukprot:6475980-Amphidinium_carterae.2